MKNKADKKKADKKYNEIDRRRSYLSPPSVV